MIHAALFIAGSAGKGRGIFTNQDIGAGVLLEASPVIIMSGEDRLLLDKTKLHDYIFEWGKNANNCAMALGYIALYNHSYLSNCEYEMDFELEEIRVKTVRSIKSGEELFINYNGDWDNQKPVWFETK